MESFRFKVVTGDQMRSSACLFKHQKICFPSAWSNMHLWSVWSVWLVL